VLYKKLDNHKPVAVSPGVAGSAAILELTKRPAPNIQHKYRIRVKTMEILMIYKRDGVLPHMKPLLDKHSQCYEPAVKRTKQ
jgi:hypothetical protein